jgi:hypothetical protein
MLATLATTVLLAVAPGGEANPECSRRSTGYDFGVSLDGHKQTHARRELGALVFPRVAVVLTFRHSIAVHNDSRRWIRISWSCEP